MRAWHSVLVVLGVLFVYEWVTTHPRKVANTIARLPQLRLPNNGSVVNETNQSVGAGQSVVAGEPDLYYVDNLKTQIQTGTVPDMQPDIKFY